MRARAPACVRVVCACVRVCVSGGRGRDLCSLHCTNEIGAVLNLLYRKAYMLRIVAYCSLSLYGAGRHQDKFVCTF